MRLDKYIASVTDYSRREIKQLIKQQLVQVNDQDATNPGQHIHLATDHITLNQQTLDTLSPRYFMLNKPKHTVCATEDSEHPTVIDLIDEPNSHKLQIAGRLDKDTTGLVLITDDGQWNHRVTSPKKACFKTYIVTLAEPFTNDNIHAIEQGIVLKNETKATLPATVKVIDQKHIALSIQEGKYHQVKRMMAALGNHVTDLHRTHIGHITLDSALEAGEYRPLSLSEIEAIQ